MPYMIGVETIADKFEEIHKKLIACGHNESAAILTSSLAGFVNTYWVEDESKLQVAELSLLEHSRVLR